MQTNNWYQIELLDDLGKFRWGWKNLDDQAGSGGPRTVESEAVLKTIEANLVSSTRRVS